METKQHPTERSSKGATTGMFSPDQSAAGNRNGRLQSGGGTGCSAIRQMT